MGNDTRMSDKVEEVYMSTGGRPAKYYRVNGMLMRKDEYEKYKNVQKTVLKPKGMDAESFSEFCKLAAPDLVQRMYELAKESEDIRAIAIVAKELSDRAWGKSVQAVQVTHSTLESAWEKADNVIDAVVDAKQIVDNSDKKE